jgi:cytochrome c oxidase subunit 2
MLDRFEKRTITATILVMMLFIFSLIYAVEKRNNNVTECIPYSTMYETPRVIKIDEKTYQVIAVARMWMFEPSQIYIPVGSEVDFYVISKDVVHGFNIAEKNVNLMAVYGGVSKTSVKFDKPGVYKITCHEYCGVGHQNMQAEVIVNYPNYQ